MHATSGDFSSRAPAPDSSPLKPALITDGSPSRYFKKAVENQAQLFETIVKQKSQNVNEV